MGKKKLNWKNMTEHEKKITRRKYMRDYYYNKRKEKRRLERLSGEKIKKKKPGFSKRYGEFIVKFQ